jgi:hypothetical protein
MATFMTRADLPRLAACARRFLAESGEQARLTTSPERPAGRSSGLRSWY